MAKITLTDTPDLLAEIDMLRRKQDIIFKMYEDTIASLQAELSQYTESGAK
jgi:hypothetical protein